MEKPIYMLMSFLFGICVGIPLFVWAVFSKNILVSPRDALLPFTEDEPVGEATDQILK